MAMRIRYEGEEFGLQDTDRNRQFVEAFRDLDRDIEGDRFTVDTVSMDWRFSNSELTFQMTKETQVAVAGHDFEEEAGSDLSALFGHEQGHDQS